MLARAKISHQESTLAVSGEIGGHNATNQNERRELNAVSRSEPDEGPLNGSPSA